MAGVPAVVGRRGQPAPLVEPVRPVDDGDRAVLVGLVENGTWSVRLGQCDEVAVLEPADPTEAAAEVVVEGAVLLHEEDHVPDGLQPAGTGLALHGLQQRGGQKVVHACSWDFVAGR